MIFSEKLFIQFWYIYYATNYEIKNVDITIKQLKTKTTTDEK